MATVQTAGNTQTQNVTVESDHPNRVMRFSEVMTITGLSRGSIYKQIAAGTFPKNISLGGRATGFLAREVDDWLRARIAARDLT